MQLKLVICVLVVGVVFVSSRSMSNRETLLEILSRGAGGEEISRRQSGDSERGLSPGRGRTRQQRVGKEHPNPREFLQRFGYLSKLAPGVEHEPENMVKAIKHFQNMYNIAESGQLDEKTRTMMAMERCGMPDTLPPDTNPNLANKAVVQAVLAENFYLPGPKWKKTALTYRFKNFWSSSILPQQTQRLAITRALKFWSDVTPLTFTETTDKADFNLAFVSPGSDHGDGLQNAFDGPGGVLAHAFYPESGEAHFDNSEKWTDDTKDGINLMTVAAHELGHGLGLGHSNVHGALMAPYYQGYDPNFKLPADDTEGIQKIYGTRTGEPPIAAAATTTTTKVTTTTTPTTTVKTRPTKNTATSTTSRPRAPGDTPDTCTVPFKAVTQAHDYRIYVFSGAWMWRLSDYGMDIGFPDLISKYYDQQAPTDIDAVIFSWKSYYTYMFKGQQVWKYYGYQLDVTKTIKTSGYTGSIQAALAANDGTIYLLKGSTCWIFNEKTNDVSSGACNSPFTGAPNNFDSAVRLTDDQNIYFFKGLNYYKYDTASRTVMADYPKVKAGPWMGPTCGSQPYTPK